MKYRARSVTAKPPIHALDKEDFKILSNFHHHLRRFLRVSEDLAQSQGRRAAAISAAAHQGLRRLLGVVSRSDLVKPSLGLFDEERLRERMRRLKIGPVLKSRFG